MVFYWTGLYFEVDSEVNADFSFAAFHFIVVIVIITHFAWFVWNWKQSETNAPISSTADV